MAQSEDFPKRFRQRLAQLDLRYADLLRYGVAAYPTLKRWNDGDTQPAGRKLERLCEVLGCTDAWLLRGEGNPPGTGGMAHCHCSGCADLRAFAQLSEAPPTPSQWRVIRQSLLQQQHI